jgi:hypothetical protein
MWKFVTENPFIVGALTGSLATYLLQLLVGFFRREKRWLGYSVSSRNIVDRGHSKLEMRFTGGGKQREVERLDSHAVLVRNIGNRPFSGLPVRVHSEKGSEILEHEVSGPQGAQITCTLEQPHQLLVACDLLNPGEGFTVGLTVADASSSGLQISARSENLVLKLISEVATTKELVEVLSGHSEILRLVFEVVTLFTRGGRR